MPLGPSQSNWDKLQATYERFRRTDGKGHLRPWRRSLWVARQNGAACVVIERRYIDRDYRSENSAVYSRVLAPIPDSTHRLHFFSEEFDDAYLDEAISSGPMAELLERSYLGYICCRPAPLEIVGRTMLRPPPGVTVRAAAEENVKLLGIRLKVRATPFMQQDSRLAVCAHVAVWSIAYMSYLRDELPRTTIADVVEASHEDMAAGSQGLSTAEVANALRKLGYRPVHYRRYWDLPLPRKFVWQTGYHEILERQEDRRGRGLDKRDKEWPHMFKPDSEEFYDRQLAFNLLPCLNSGVPVYVAGGGHAFLLCGYQRRNRSNGGQQIEYVLHDDQIGPYVRVWSPSRDLKLLRYMQVPDGAGDPDQDEGIAKAHESAHSKESLEAARDRYGSTQSQIASPREWLDLLFPLLSNVHLGFAAAEDYAVARFDSRARELDEAGYETSLLRRVEDPSHALEDKPVELKRLIRGEDKLTVRTYMTLSSAFKESLILRGAGFEIAEEYRKLRLPVYVHVVEFLMGDMGGKTPRVLGEVVLDATSGDGHPWVHVIRVAGSVLFTYSDGRVYEGWMDRERFVWSGSPGGRAQWEPALTE